MARTRKDHFSDDSVREAESEAHKNRRQVSQQLREYYQTDFLDEYDDDDFETFEPIKPKYAKK